MFKKAAGDVELQDTDAVIGALAIVWVLGMWVLHATMMGGM